MNALLLTTDHDADAETRVDSIESRRRSRAEARGRWLRAGVNAALIVPLVLLLVAALPSLFGYHAVSVIGGSMEPTIPVGAVAVTKPVSAESVKVGDVIAFQVEQASRPTLHRVVEIVEVDGERLAITKGDNNGHNDPNKVVLTGTTEQLRYHVPWVGYLYVFLRSVLGRLLLFLAVGAWLVWVARDHLQDRQPKDVAS
jgi:signal peptidase I